MRELLTTLFHSYLGQHYSSWCSLRKGEKMIAQEKVCKEQEKTWEHTCEKSTRNCMLKVTCCNEKVCCLSCHNQETNHFVVSEQVSHIVCHKCQKVVPSLLPLSLLPFPLPSSPLIKFVPRTHHMSKLHTVHKQNSKRSVMGVVLLLLLMFVWNALSLTRKIIYFIVVSARNASM
jgi:hypothetical protein